MQIIQLHVWNVVDLGKYRVLLKQLIALDSTLKGRNSAGGGRIIDYSEIVQLPVIFWRLKKNKNHINHWIKKKLNEYD